MLFCAARRRGWPRLLGPVVAFTLLTLPLAALLTQLVIADGLAVLGVGGSVFLAAMLGLTLLTAVSVRAITRA